MSTTTAILDDRTLDNIMSLREYIMDYYKGTCVQNLASGKDVHGMYLSDFVEHTPYYRQRLWEMQQNQPYIVLLNNKPIFTLEREKIIIYTNIKATEVVRTEVEKFMARYLEGIKVTKTAKAPKVGTNPLRHARITEEQLNEYLESINTTVEFRQSGDIPF